MELELGLKITHTRGDLTSSSNLQIVKDQAGPVFVSRETETMFILTAHLKGFMRENVDININEDGTRIAISGKKPVQEIVMRGWIVYKKEVEMRGFTKAFQIPDGVVLDRIKAKFNEEESVLTIFMPKMVKGICGLNIEEVKEEEGKTALTESFQEAGKKVDDGGSEELDHKDKIEETVKQETEEPQPETKTPKEPESDDQVEKRPQETSETPCPIATYPEAETMEMEPKKDEPKPKTEIDQAPEDKAPLPTTEGTRSEETTDTDEMPERGARDEVLKECAPLQEPIEPTRAVQEDQVIQQPRTSPSPTPPVQENEVKEKHMIEDEVRKVEGELNQKNRNKNLLLLQVMSKNLLNKKISKKKLRRQIVLLVVQQMMMNIKRMKRRDKKKKLIIVQRTKFKKRKMMEQTFLKYHQKVIISMNHKLIKEKSLQVRRGLSCVLQLSLQDQQFWSLFLCLWFT